MRLPLLTLLLSTAALANPFPHRISEGANVTDYEQKGIDALLQLANLAMHVPESFIVDNYRAKDVVTQIDIFDQLGAKKIMAGGFVSIFMDLVKSDVEIMQLLKSIDIRLSMLTTSSKNYTTVLDQWLLFLHNDGQCYNSYHNSIKLV